MWLLAGVLLIWSGKSELGILCLLMSELTVIRNILEKLNED
jgi:hypothetical protein